ncbi:MAG: hypothetical protein HQ490_00650 [Lutibacter sp.]|nr:hypothetical protein [Lutibacter sp.]
MNSKALKSFFSMQKNNPMVYSKDTFLNIHKPNITLNESFFKEYSNDIIFSIEDKIIFFSEFYLIYFDLIGSWGKKDFKNYTLVNYDPIYYNNKTKIEIEIEIVKGKDSWIGIIPTENHLKGKIDFAPFYFREKAKLYSDLLAKMKQHFDLLHENELLEIENAISEREKKKEQDEIDRIKKLSLNQLEILNKLDNDNDGEVDLIENDFNKLFTKNQKRVMEMDKNYIHQFVKVSNFIKTKKQNTQKIFESIRDTSTQEELEERVNLLKNQIHSYELLLFHSINMIGALVSEDLITFYEIYESFDKLGMFNSNWENEVSEKLTNIGDKLDDLMYSIYNMEQNIVSELSHLSYVTQESFEDLNRSVTSQLIEVQSSINTNNLLTGIQAYQLYKINKNTKGLRQ